MSYSTSIDDLLQPENTSSTDIQQNVNFQQQPPMQQFSQQPVDNNQFVDAILSELDNIPDSNAAAFNNTVDQVHIPPPHLPETANLLRAEETQSLNLTNDSVSLNPSSTNSMIKRYQKHLIVIAVVFALTIIFNLNQVNRLIFGYLPKLILENGQISIYGILLKSVIITIIIGVLMFLV